MKSSFWSAYSVDRVPAILKLPFLIYGYGLGLILRFYFLMIYITSKIEFEGQERLGMGPHIFCFWHQDTITHFCVFTFTKKFNFICINHSAWYMKPIHVIMMFSGVKRIILGSTGHSGRQAADELVECIRQGHSTYITPDGPSGPPRVMRKGALHVSLQSKVPVVAIRYEPSRFFNLKTWDKKRMLLPFSRIKVVLSAPVQVTEENFNSVIESVTAALG